MYARSTTFQAQPGSIDEGIAYVRDEVMPDLMAMDGCTRQTHTREIVRPRVSSKPRSIG